MEEEVEIFEKYLKKYIPITFVFSGIKRKDLKNIVKRYTTRHENLLNIENTEEVDYLPHCIFDLLVLAENDNSQIKKYEQFLRHIDNIIKHLIGIVDMSLHTKLKNSIKQMITSVDEEIGCNYQYLNFYGEILGLYFFLTKSNDFKLIDIERQLPNGKSVDFVFKHIEDHIPLYVDFISFHNIKPELLETDEDFISFFEKRFNDKIEAKSKDLEYDKHFLVIEGVKIPFLILPIIWGDMKDFIDKKDAIEKLDLKYLNVSNLSSLMVQESSDKILYYDFTTISNILKRIISEKE
jgi:hypothetical protein